MHAPRVWGGGMESHICELTAELLDRNVDVTLAVCSKFGGTSGRRDMLLARGATFADVSANDGAGVRKLLDLVSFRREVGDLRRFDAIVCHGVGMSHILASAGRQDARLVWHDHLSGGETITNEQEFSQPGVRHYPWLFRRFLNRANAVITGSERGRKNLQNVQLIKSEVHVIPPLCILPEAEKQVHGERSSTITCGIFGNLSSQKNTEPLLRLWAHSDLSQIRLLVFGNDHERGYERLAKNMGLRNIEFRGPYRENKLAVHAEEIDFAIIASAIEGYPLVAIELMACGVPLVATMVGACPEFDSSGRNVVLAAHEAESVLSGILRMAQQIKSGAVDREVIRKRAREIYDRRSIVERHLQVICGT